jgi:hypothetical protein
VWVHTLQVIVVLDGGSEPLPDYTGAEHQHRWERSAIASWDSGEVRPPLDSWEEVTTTMAAYPKVGG